MKRILPGVVIWMLLTLCPQSVWVTDALANPFASNMVSYSGTFGASPYDDPESVIGKPTTWVYDPGWPPLFPAGTYACSMVYAAWNTDPDENKLITTIGTNAEIVVEFDHPVVDNPDNWYGLDFIVYGNSFFEGLEGSVSTNTDMENYHIKDGGGWFEEVKVSISQDATNWYTYGSGPYGDSLFPTQPFAWDRNTHTWGEELDWTKPVNPSLNASDFAGYSVADAIDLLYDGSAGGTGFDLQESGYPWIQYIRVSGLAGAQGEIDGFSDVSPVPEPAILTLLGSGLSLLFWRQRRKRNISQIRYRKKTF